VSLLLDVTRPLAGVQSLTRFELAFQFGGVGVGEHGAQSRRQLGISLATHCGVNPSQLSARVTLPPKLATISGISLASAPTAHLPMVTT
jgi:hypothetical protein